MLSSSSKHHVQYAIRVIHAAMKDPFTVDVLFDPKQTQLLQLLNQHMLFAVDILTDLVGRTFFRDLFSLDWLKARLILRHPIHGFRALARNDVQITLVEDTLPRLAVELKKRHQTAPNGELA